MKDDSNIQNAKQKLLDAITDHPKEGLLSFDGLLKELNKSIPFPITMNKLQTYSKKIDLSTNAWEVESISSVLEAFHGFENNSLEEIIEMIGQSDHFLP